MTSTLLFRSPAACRCQHFSVIDVAPETVPRVAYALGITFSAARQLLDGEVDARRWVVDKARSTADRDRYLHRRGVLP